MATKKIAKTAKPKVSKKEAKEKKAVKAKAPKKVEVTVPSVQTEEAPKKGISGRYVYAVGRRKTAVAQIRLYPSTGGLKENTVNSKTAKMYFGTDDLVNVALSPIKVVGKENDFILSALVRGGGLHGQAGAIRLGVARALIVHDLGLRAVLKAQGFLTRDSRAVERKKPGLKKARRAPQWAKR